MKIKFNLDYLWLVLMLAFIVFYFVAKDSLFIWAAAIAFLIFLLYKLFVIEDKPKKKDDGDFFEVADDKPTPPGDIRVPKLIGPGAAQ